MKTKILILILSFVLQSELFAQQQTDTTLQRHQQKKQRTRLMDENGDGIRDGKMNKANDKFIDSNGDGICDNRERGLGFRRGANPSGNQFGKKQQVGRK